MSMWIELRISEFSNNSSLSDMKCSSVQLHREVHLRDNSGPRKERSRSVDDDELSRGNVFSQRVTSGHHNASHNLQKGA